MVKKIFSFILLFFIIIFYIYLKNIPLNNKEVIFHSCVDGDTAVFIIDDIETTVRFLAIDAPEYNDELEKEVSNYVCNTLNEASRITLEYEEGVNTDKYNRVLAWIYVDDRLLQKDLIEKGYAQIKYIYDDYKYVNELEIIQKQAKEKKLGIWK